MLPSSRCACNLRALLRSARSANVLIDGESVGVAAAAQTCRALSSTSSSSSSSNSSSSSSKPWTWLAAGLAGAAWAAYPAHAESKKEGSTSLETDDDSTAERKLLPLHMRQRIFFKYEKRIRELSSLEKVFEYFATQQEDGVKYMTKDDLARSLVPTYPPSDSSIERAGNLDGEHRDRALASGPTTKLISFPEYVVTVLLLSIPEDEVHAVFDLMDMDGNGTLDAQEFLQVINALERRAGIQDSFVNRVGRHQHTTAGDPKDVLQIFFGQSSSKKLHLPKFRAHLQALHANIVATEFCHYDVTGRGWISGTDFARSIVTPADVRHVDRLLDKVDELPPQLAQARVRLAEFKEMAAVRRRLSDISFALKFCRQVGRPVTRADFHKLLDKVAGIKVSPLVTDLLFAVFGDAAGELDSAALVEVLQRRDKLPGKRLLIPAGTTIMNQDQPAIMRWWNCIKKCTEDDTSSY